ncbi:hypothetical protein EG68_02947 [Paragonimus skrjabini miyazakii]|uniref:Uncharacterized protein n=1 Tax=Paragonimus skrjabini miyazakii TaxID=59628 RepID=A0A8S9Z2N3_9TREM|nr:hypothetical protein EG68_02947 [Paragonimus skrjabini miyazakii]
MYFVLDYRLHIHHVTSPQEGNDDDLDKDFSYLDEKLLSELQTDFEINWVPKLIALHPEHPLAVQLNIDKFGSGTHPDSNDITFDVFYNGAAHFDHPIFLIETVISINQLRQTSIYSEDKPYIESVLGIEPILPPVFDEDTPTLVSGACPTDKMSANTCCLYGTSLFNLKPYTEHYLDRPRMEKVLEDLCAES